MLPSTRTSFRFGEFELDVDAEELRRNGRQIKLQPQPFKLLLLIVRRAGTLVTRDEIRAELWPEGTFVDFDQAVNFAVKQIRDAIGDSADRPVYVQTVPRRGYRFIAPVEAGAVKEAPHPPVPGESAGTTTVRLQKALWANIAELRVAQERQRRITAVAAMITGAVVIGALVIYLLLR